MRSVIDKYGDLTGKRLFRFADKYVNHYRLNVALCRGLKVIGEDTGIGNLQFYCVRHSFATTVTLANGVPIESVSKMLGHTDIRTTQIYAKVIDTKLSNDMELLAQKLNSKCLVTV